MKNRNLLIDLLIIILLGLAPLLWFKSGYLIKTEDIGLPLNFLEWKNIFYSWDEQAAAGCQPFDQFPAVVFFFLPAVLQKLGLGLIAVQKIQFIFWFMLPGFSIYYLMNTLLRSEIRRMAGLAAVSFYMFNLYLESIWAGFNVANISLYGFMPLFLAVFIRGLRGDMAKIKALSLIGLISFLMSGIGVNAPVLYVFGFMCLISFTFYLISYSRGENLKKIFVQTGYVFLVILIVIAVNFFWIFPLFKQYLEVTLPSSLGDYYGNVRAQLEDLAKDVNAVKTARLQGAWSWYRSWHEPYIPYGEFFRTNPVFIILSWVVPFLSLGALFFVKKNRHIILFFLLAVLGIILSAGFCPPTGWVYKFLFNFFPLFSIIRSPWHKFGFLLVFGYVFLSSYTAAEAALFLNRRVKAGCGWMLVLLIMVVNLTYAYPVTLGRMFISKEERTFLPPHHIKMPEYVLEAADWLNAQREFFRIFVLPSRERRMIDWGYIGYEPVISYFTPKTVIAPYFEIHNFGYSEAAKADEEKKYKMLYEHLYGSKRARKLAIEKLRPLEAEDYINKSSDYINKIFPLFNIKYLLHERDFRYKFYSDDDSPDFVRKKLSCQRGVEFLRSFGKWDFYEVKRSLPRIYAAAKAVYVDSETERLASLANSSALETNVFIMKNEYEKLKDWNLYNHAHISKALFYDTKNFDPSLIKDAQIDYFYLFSSGEEDAFLKREDKENYFLEDRLKLSVHGENMQEADLTLEGRWFQFADDEQKQIVVENTDSSALKANLKFSVYSLADKTSLYIYLDGKLYDLVIIPQQEELTVRLEDINLKPGLNSLSFKTRPFSPAGDGKVFFKNNFLLYDFAFKGKIYLPRSGEYQIELFPFPLHLSPDKEQKEIFLNGNKIDLLPRLEKNYYACREKNILDEGYYDVLVNQDKEGLYFYLHFSPVNNRESEEFLPLSYKQINPVRYMVEVETKEPFFLIFNEGFSPKWTAYLSAKTGNLPLKKHLNVNGFANGWYVEPIDLDRQRMTIMLKYEPQIYFTAGLLFSVSAVVVCLIILIFPRKETVS